MSILRTRQFLQQTFDLSSLEWSITVGIVLLEEFVDGLADLFLGHFGRWLVALGFLEGALAVWFGLAGHATHVNNKIILSEIIVIHFIANIYNKLLNTIE